MRDVCAASMRRTRAVDIAITSRTALPTPSCCTLTTRTMRASGPSHNHNAATPEAMTSSDTVPPMLIPTTPSPPCSPRPRSSPRGAGDGVEGGLRR